MIFCQLAAIWLVSPLDYFFIFSIYLWHIPLFLHLIMVKQFYRGEIGYDFAIRTPCTPSRWDEFDGEMTMAWEVSYGGPLT